MKTRQCNKSMIMLVLLLTTVILSNCFGPINTGPLRINTKDTTLPIKSQEPHTSQIIAWESNGTVISNALRDQAYYFYYSKVCSDGAGGAIITWVDARGLDLDIYAQRIDSNGNALWGNDSIWGGKEDRNGTVICNAIGEQQYPTLCSDGAGGAIIIWEDLRSTSTTKPDIYTQRIDSDGKTRWKANGTVICNATSVQTGPNVCYDEKTKGAIIIWHDNRSETSLVYDIYVQKIDPDGNPLWKKNGTAICNATGDQNLAIICSDGAGGAIITWQDHRTHASSYSDIYAQHVDSDGTTQWGESWWGGPNDRNGSVICNVSYSQEIPDICYSRDGGAIITWEDKRVQGTHVYAQKIASDGSILWTKNGTVISNATEHQKYPYICSDGAGGAIITWIDDRGLDRDIYAQKIDINGKVYWGDDSIWGGKNDLNGTVICNATGDQNYHQICSDGAGGAIITWIDDRGLDWDIYAQKIDINGKVYWGDDSIWGGKNDLNGTVICNADGVQKIPKICSDNAGGAIIIWQDTRDVADSGVDIYAQRIKHSPTGIYVLGDDDDDDDEEEEMNILLIVIIIVLISVGALTIIIVVLIKKGVIQIPKSVQRNK